MKELIKEFKHIAREVTIYLLPGLVLVGYCLFIYYFSQNMGNWRSFIDIKSTIIILFVSYILGHIVMGLMEFLFVIIPIEKQIKKIKPFKKKSTDLDVLEEDHQEGKLEVLAFEDKEKYYFFVERHTLLSLFRWNLSGVFLINTIITIIFSINYCCCFWWVSIIHFLLFIVFLLFSIQTELDGRQRRYYLAKKHFDELA